MQPINKQIGANGSFFVDNSSTEPAYLYEVTEAAVVTVLTEEGSVDVMSEQNVSGKTLPAGTKLTPRRGHFTAITITSGSVEGYRI